MNKQSLLLLLLIIIIIIINERAVKMRFSFRDNTYTGLVELTLDADTNETHLKMFRLALEYTLPKNMNEVQALRMWGLRRNMND